MVERRNWNNKMWTTSSGEGRRCCESWAWKKKINLSWQDTRSLTGKEREEKRKEKEKRNRVVIYVVFGLVGF